MSKGFLVVVNKVGNIVKVFDVISSIPFRSIPGPANNVFNRAVFAFFYCLFIKQMVYLKGFGGVNVTIDKHGRGHVKMETIKKVIGIKLLLLQLCYLSILKIISSLISTLKLSIKISSFQLCLGIYLDCAKSEGQFF